MVELIAFCSRTFISQDAVLMADALFTSLLAGILIICLWNHFASSAQTYMNMLLLEIQHWASCAWLSVPWLVWWTVSDHAASFPSLVANLSSEIRETWTLLLALPPSREMRLAASHTSAAVSPFHLCHNLQTGTTSYCIKCIIMLLAQTTLP